MNIVNGIRNILWRILGVDYHHVLKVIDYVYLKEDTYTEIGHKSYCNNALVYRWNKDFIKIGKYCSIADGVRFIVDNDRHQIGKVTSYPFIFNPKNSTGGIEIGNDVWIGQNVIILPGVKIGDGVTIGSGAVVNTDIPDYCVVGGIPAKILYHKCSEPEKDAMKNISWWNWDDAKIENNQDDFFLTISEFVRKYKDA